MRTVRSSLEERDVTAKAVGWGCAPTMAPEAVAAPLPPVSIRARPDSLTANCMVYFWPSKVEDRSAVPSGMPARVTS
jgi:hypothetical protein